MFIATYWWVWLVFLILAVAYALYNQLSRMKRMTTRVQSFDLGGTFEGTLRGTGKLAVAAVIAWVSGILLAIAGTIHLIDYIKQ